VVVSFVEASQKFVSVVASLRREGENCFAERSGLMWSFHLLKQAEISSYCRVFEKRRELLC
jgi:hypothetical protein